MKKTAILTVLLTCLATTPTVSAGFLGIGTPYEKMKCKVEYTLKNTESGLVEEVTSISRFKDKIGDQCKSGTKKLVKKVKKLIKNDSTIQDISPIECKRKIRGLSYKECGSKYDKDFFERVSN
jgi:thermostable 8-oxoguanine DNA glycosylase